MSADEQAAGEWVLISMDEKLARRQGVPARVPVPRAEFDGLAEKGMSLAQTRKWVADFLGNAPIARSASWRAENAALVSAFEAFLSKADLWTKAQQAFAQNDFKKAISTLKLIASVDPQDHAAKMNLASALANTGDHAGARKHLEAIRATFAGDADYHLTVGHILMAQGELQKAAEELALALEANPACKPAMDALVKLGVLVPIYENPRDAASLVYLRADGIVAALAAEWDAAPRDAAFYLEQLAYHEAERRADVALAAADRALAAGGADPLLLRARMGRVAALRALGKGDEARREAEAELARAPDAAWAHVELARCLFDEGKMDDARARLDRALALDPGDQTALMLRYYPSDAKDIAQVNACIPLLAAFAEANGGVAGVWRSLARAKVLIGADDDAATIFARAVAIAPADDELRAEYWAHLDRLRRFDELLGDAAKVSDLKTRDWKLRWNEAEAYRSLGKSMEARAAFAAINMDESLHVDVRKRAKRAVQSLEGRGTQGP